MSLRINRVERVYPSRETKNEKREKNNENSKQSKEERNRFFEELQRKAKEGTKERVNYEKRRDRDVIFNNIIDNER